MSEDTEEAKRFFREASTQLQMGSYQRKLTAKGLFHLAESIEKLEKRLQNLEETLHRIVPPEAAGGENDPMQSD